MPGNKPGSMYSTRAYTLRSAALRRAATANAETRCLGGCKCEALHVSTCTCGKACGKRLHEHPPTTRGNPAKWSAGHVRPNDANAPLRPEVLSCNIVERNERINAARSSYRSVEERPPVRQFDPRLGTGTFVQQPGGGWSDGRGDW